MKTHAFANPPTPVEEGGARKGVPSSRGQTHAAGMRDRRGSEAAFGFESPPPQTFPGSGQLRSSVWLRKSAPSNLSRQWPAQKQRLASKVRPSNLSRQWLQMARPGARGQKNGRKRVFFVGMPTQWGGARCSKPR